MYNAMDIILLYCRDHKYLVFIIDANKNLISSIMTNIQTKAC